MGEEEEEEIKLSVSEVRRTIATSLAAAFGFVIALLWKEVVLGGLATAGINLAAGTDLTGWTVGVVTAIALTVMMIIFIIIISRWGGKK
jgi:Flp pilus assembly secretin CpaC